MSRRRVSMKRMHRPALLLYLGLSVLLLCACGGREPIAEAERAAEAGKSVSLAELQSVNSDIVAWLYIPGTELNAPVLRSPEDALYYTSHAYDGQQDPAGALFVQAAHSGESLSEAVTVVYGASEGPQAPFAGLQTAFCENGALERHSPLWLYTAEGRSAWQVIGVSVWSNRHISAAYRDFKSPEDIGSFVDAVRGYRTMVHAFDDSASVSAGDRLLVLSTHVKDSPEERFLVLAKQAAG